MLHILRWALGGLLYGLLEVLFRGYTHWTMMALAAVLCVPLDIANEHMPWELPIWLQAILGGAAITAAELAAGVVLNIWMGLDIWDYAGLPGNLWGQICPQFTAVWCVLAGPVIAAFDWMDYLLGQGERPHYRWI